VQFRLGLLFCAVESGGVESGIRGKGRGSPNVEDPN